MKHRFLVFLLVLTFILSFAPLSHSLTESNDRIFNVETTGPNHTEIEFNLDNYELLPIEVNGTTYQRLYHNESGFLMEEGLPEVLSFSFVLAVPNRGTVELDDVVNIDYKIIPDINLFPSQGFDLEISPVRGFVKDYDFYSKNVKYPLQTAEVSAPAIMRDLRLVSVTVYPFSYNPALRELTVRNRFSVRINYNTEALGENEITGPPRRLSRSFERFYEGSVLNYEQFRNRNIDYQARSILVIYNHNTSIVNVVNEFVNWKRNKGFEITAVSTINMTTNTAIKNYIQNAYNTWEHPPEYIVLIGGASGSLAVPAWNLHSGWGDHPYTLLDGNDDLADAFIGRLAVDNVTQLMTIWNKITNYERTPFLGDTSWYERALLVGDPSSSGISTIITNKYLKEIMLRHNSDYSFFEVYNAPFASQMNNGINQGVTTFNYRGYVNMSQWSPNDASLNNGLRLPNCVFLTCSSLSYLNSTSRTDYMVRMGTPTTSKGGVTAIGMTTSLTRTAFNNCLGGGIYYGIFVDNMRTMGEALARGQLNLWQVYGNSHPSQPPRFSQWTNLIGDPSMDIWVEEPKPLDVNYESLLFPGSNSITINVTDSTGAPVQDAWVTIRQGADVIFATDYTDETGKVLLFFDPENSGIVNLTVTKPDYIPHLGSFEIGGEAGITYHDAVVNNDIVAGSTLNFTVMAKNHSDQLFNGVEGTISTDDDYITIIENSSSFGSMAAGTVAESLTDFVISIAPETPSNHRTVFLLTTSDVTENEWESRFTFTVLNGNLIVQSIVINDGGNGILDPAEQAQLLVHLKNEGQTDLESISGIISGEAQGFSIVDSTASFGNILSGQTVTSTGDHFVISAASYVIPGMSFELDLYLYNNFGFSQQRSIVITVGEITVTDPMGPDEYGYWCYDDGDIDYLEAPVYEWIEIAPQLGGSGINTNLQSNHDNLQQVMTMDLPFTFKFYGVEYDQVSICANGWIAMGVTEQATFRNWRLPGPLGPSSIIAAFWDNLSLAQGGVYTHYDAAQNIFIVQWQNALNIVGNAPETFQIILYDPMYYYTTTGDGLIKIQYKVFNNVNNTTGSPYGSWGNYSTIGIADHTCTIGLEYSFNNQYPTAASPLGNERAILFTTGSVDYDNAFVAIETYSIHDDNNNIPEYGETVSLLMTLVNLGAEEAHNISAILSTQDTYVTVTADSAFYGSLEQEETAVADTPYIIEIADNVPHMHRAQFILQISADDNNSWTHYFNLDLNAPELTTLTPIIYDPLPGGNDNGLIDPGEDITLYLPIKNSGGSPTEPVTLSVTSLHPLVTINSISNTEFNPLQNGETIFPGLDLSINQNIVTGTEIAFDYTLQTGSYTFTGQAYTNVGGLVQAQLGSGTATNSTTDGNPINIWFRSLRGQMVYTASELNAAGISGAGSITQFGFYVVSPPIHPLPNFIIRMKHTTATNASSHDAGPFTTVSFTNSYTPVAEQWNMFTLSTPFAWDGVSNILVDTAFAQVPSWNSSGQQRVYNVPNGYRFVRADGSDQTNATTTTVSSNKPQAMIVLITSTGDGSIVRPQNLTAEYANSEIHLQWQPPAERGLALANPQDSFENREREKHGRNPSPRAGITGQTIERETPSALQSKMSENDLTREDLEGYGNRSSRTLLGYNVYRNGNMLNSALIGETAYFDSDVEPLVDYYYYVTALFTDGESEPSNIVHIELANRVETPVFNPPAGYYNSVQSVVIETATENAILYYTTDGSEPDENSPLYSTPIELPLNTNVLVKAKGFHVELLPSETASGEYFISQTIPTPQFSPEPGIYLEPVTVNISLPENIWNIYYTLDGSVPDLNSSLFTEPLEINYSTTVKARGFADNWLPSEIATANYTVLNPPESLVAEAVSENVFLEWEEPLMGGTLLSVSANRIRNRQERSTRENLLGYDVYRSIGNQNNFVQINDELVTENIYTDSNLTANVYYYAVKAVYTEGLSLYSNIAEAEILMVAQPQITPPSGAYYETISVEINTQTTGAAVFYTTDGTDPTEDDIPYVSPFEISNDTEIRARAYKENWICSEIVSAQYYFLYSPGNLTVEGYIGYALLNWEEPQSPVSFLSKPEEKNGIRMMHKRRQGTTLSSNRSDAPITMRDEKRGVLLYNRTLIGYNVYRSTGDDNFTLINDTPVPETTYQDQGLVPGIYNYYVTALYSEGESQPTETVTVNIGGIVSNPVFDPEPGTYEEPIYVSITTETENAVIFYTLDGDEPDNTSPVYEEPLYLEETTIIKAFAYIEEWQSSEVVTGHFVIEPAEVDDTIIGDILTTELFSAYPNPFNPSTTIFFVIEESGHVVIDVFNIRGKRVRTLLNQNLDRGKHSVRWFGEDDYGKKLSSGIYFYRMVSGDYSAVKKMILLK